MENQVMEERYALSMGRLLELQDEERVREPYRTYFKKTAQFIGICGEVLEAALEGGLSSWSGDKLRTINKRLYEDILEEHYKESYANPAFAARELGRELGRLLSFLYTEIRGDIVYAFEGRMAEFVRLNEAFLEIYSLFGDGTPEEKSVQDVLYWYASDYCGDMLTARLRETLDPSADFAKRIIMESDLSDLSYLYRFGEYVSPNEEGLAAFLNGLPKETVKQMADTFTEGFVRGFAVMRRDLSKKKSVAIRFPLGMERMVREAVRNFEACGLSVLIPRAAADSVNRNPMGKAGYSSTPPNRQYEYDHRYDSAVFLDKAFCDRKLAALKTAYETLKKEAADYAGPAVIESFGEAGFEPENKEEAWAFSKRQQKLYLEYKNRSMPVANRYIPGDETSFTIIAFPVPAIGADFADIFAETIRINTLDYELYKTMQQRMIDVLDRADYVEVIGRGANTTNIRVRLAPLSDPAKETRFENCLADVNIPLGEVFTSPVLSGTCGTVNVESVYVGEICFKNLTLTFEDGRVVSADCDNFTERLPLDAGREARQEAKEAGRRLIQQQIMNNHERLPLGEFAIGTNTTAYAVAERYGILDRLPILIVEKMGPHFAVGDTCYSWSEDSPMYNPDGKEMIARDNEISILRKEDVSKAYFGVHTDLTIPYRELGRITAVGMDGERIDMIRDGRFVLAGLGELNRPLSF